MKANLIDVSRSTSIPPGVRNHSAKKPRSHLWGWVCIAIALPVVVVLSVAQSADTRPIKSAVEIEPAVLDQFNERLNAARGFATEKQAHLNNLWIRMTR